MSDQREEDWSRREFVGGLVVGGAGGLLGGGVGVAAAEPPPETTRIRLSVLPSVCLAPQYVAEGLLRNEGFVDVQYVPVPSGSTGGVPGEPSPRKLCTAS